MNLSKSEIIPTFRIWLDAWNNHDLEGVMNLLHDDVVFDNWTGTIISGKKLLRKAWIPWFTDHGNFKFTEEEVFFDEEEQKMLFKWILEWPSSLSQYKGKREIRQGVDVLRFKDGKIIHKNTFSKITVQIEGLPVPLQ